MRLTIFLVVTVLEDTDWRIALTPAVSGTIGFVRLVTPRLVRLLTGPNHRYLLPLSILFGKVWVEVSPAD